MSPEDELWGRPVLSRGYSGPTIVSEPVTTSTAELRDKLAAWLGNEVAAEGVSKGEIMVQANARAPNEEGYRKMKLKFIKILDGGSGEMRLYKTDGTPNYVIISATVVPYGGGPETYIFPADEEGKVIDWSEMEGSFEGGLDHDAAIINAGWELVEG